MKTALKILTALAAVVGAVYVVATYGDKIVQWAKNLLGSCSCRSDWENVEEDFLTDEPLADVAAPAVEEPVVEEPVVEEAEVEIVVESNEPVAEEADFEA